MKLIAVLAMIGLAAAAPLPQGDIKDFMAQASAALSNLSGSRKYSA